MLAKKMADSKIDDETKLRLIIIASFALEFNESERKQLTQSFSKQNQFIVSKLTLLGLNADKGSRRLSQKFEAPVHQPVDKMKNIPSCLCRHLPTVDGIVPDMIANKADPSRYGMLCTPGYDGALLSRGNQKKLYQNTKLERDQKKLPKLIFFIIGGIARSEIRVLTEASKTNANVKILAGSTSITNAQEYFKAIEDMANGETSLTDGHQNDASHVNLNIEDEYDL